MKISQLTALPPTVVLVFLLAYVAIQLITTVGVTPSWHTALPPTVAWLSPTPRLSIASTETEPAAGTGAQWQQRTGGVGEGYFR